MFHFKKRIIMNKKEKSKSQVIFKYVLLVSLIACLTGINVKISAQNQSTADSLVSVPPDTATVAVQMQQPLDTAFQISTNDEEEVFLSAEQNPEFPGGVNELFKFINKNLHYPERAMEQGIQDKIVVRFIVEKDGSVSNAVAIRGEHEILKVEAIRVIQSLPKFKPGSQNGKPVRVYYTLPINFKTGRINIL